MKVKFKKSRKPDPSLQWLSQDKIYYVIGIESDDFRIIGEDGKPYLYPHQVFEVVDSTEPSDWLTEYGEGGERYSYPEELNSCGFFEDYFDRNPKAIKMFNKYLKKIGFKFSSENQ